MWLVQSHLSCIYSRLTTSLCIQNQNDCVFVPDTSHTGYYVQQVWYIYVHIYIRSIVYTKLCCMIVSGLYTAGASAYGAERMYECFGEPDEAISSHHMSRMIWYAADHIIDACLSTWSCCANYCRCTCYTGTAAGVQLTWPSVYDIQQQCSSIIDRVGNQSVVLCCDSVTTAA